MRRSERRTKMVARILAVILVIAMLLMSGMYVLSAFAYGGTNFAVYAASAEEQQLAVKRLASLSDLLLYIHDNYKDEIKVDDLIDAAYGGVFDSLDRWSVFYPNDPNVEAFVSSIEKNYAGIGVTFIKMDGWTMIKDVHSLGPAFAAGIRAGDIITKVDGTSVHGFTLEEVSSRTRGEAGTEVNIMVLHEDGTEQTYTIKRENLSAQSVSWSMLEDGVGYIKISSFTSSTAKEFNIVRLLLMSQGAQKLVMDLRDNGGGIMSGVIKIADALMPEGVITIYEQQGNIVETFNSVNNNTNKVPMAVLINGNTASASECLAAALQDSKTAVLVGNKTYGKGCAQSVVGIEGEGSMKLTVYYFLRPNGQKIDGVGVSPDYVVYNSCGYNSDKIAEIAASVLPMDEGKKYKVGERGLNVLAAQQRLAVMGYDVDKTAVVDAKTAEALKKIQAQYKVCPYGALDFCTIGLVERAYNEFLFGDSEDKQLKKALEVLANEAQ